MALETRKRFLDMAVRDKLTLASEGLPATMRTALHIAPLLVLPAERHTAVWAGVVFHLSTSSLGEGIQILGCGLPYAGPVACARSSHRLPSDKA